MGLVLSDDSETIVIQMSDAYLEHLFVAVHTPV